MRIMRRLLWILISAIFVCLLVLSYYYPKITSYRLGYVVILAAVVWTGVRLHTRAEEGRKKAYGEKLGLKTQYPGDIADTLAWLDSDSTSAALHQYDEL